MCVCSKKLLRTSIFVACVALPDTAASRRFACRRISVPQFSLMFTPTTRQATVYFVLFWKYFCMSPLVLIGCCIRPQSHITPPHFIRRQPPPPTRTYSSFSIDVGNNVLCKKTPSRSNATTRSVVCTLSTTTTARSATTTCLNAASAFASDLLKSRGPIQPPPASMRRPSQLPRRLKKVVPKQRWR